MKARTPAKTLRKPSPRSWTFRVGRLQLRVAAGVLVLCGVVGVSWQSSQSASEDGAALNHARALLSAASDWKDQNGELGCPTVTQLLVDHQLTDEKPSADPWGGRFRIICNGEEIQVRSAGRDGEFQTRDDVTLSGNANT